MYDLSVKLLATLTNYPLEVAGIVEVDEKTGTLYYMARSGENHMKLQLHRVKLDGTGDVCLTDPAFNHTVDISPNGKYFIDVAQTHDIPPFTQLLDDKGRQVSKLAESDLTKFNEPGLKKVEAFTFTSVDGKTQLHGLLHFPSNFDPNKKYPLLEFTELRLEEPLRRCVCCVFPMFFRQQLPTRALPIGATTTTFTPSVT